MRIIENIHDKFVLNRRVRKLCDHLTGLIPEDANVLDVGCGDGLLAYLISQKRSDIELNGIDVQVRSETYVPVTEFNGQVIPFNDSSFDVVMFVDVLHHTENPRTLLSEAARVARKAIIIKDHTLTGLFARQTLEFMDKVGNLRHGVVLTYNYLNHKTWLEIFTKLGLGINVWKTNLGLYPWPTDYIFGRSFHFIASLYKTN